MPGIPITPTKRTEQPSTNQLESALKFSHAFRLENGNSEPNPNLDTEDVVHFTQDLVGRITT